MRAIKRIIQFINGHPLARRNLFAAYYRFIRWQIRSRITGRPIPVPFIEGVRFLATRGATGVTGNIYTGLHDFEEMSFLLHLLRKEDLFFDIGSNAGSYTLLASGVNRCRTISFEPVTSSFNNLKANIELNEIGHLVTAEQKGAGNNPGKFYFTSSYGPVNHVQLPGNLSGSNEEVEVIMLDNYFPASIPVLLKIDVEGFEQPVLEGAGQIIKDQTLKAIIIELNGSGRRYGYDDQEIHQYLLTEGFRPYQYLPFARQLAPLKSYSNTNTIYVRDYDFVMSRLSSAPSVNVFNSII